MTDAAALADEVLTRTAPGELTAVVGRPASGVSRVLTEVVRLAAARPGPTPVLASWERPASHPNRELSGADVRVPDIIGWDIDELARCRDLADAPEATVVCVDYVQLIGPMAQVAPALEQLAAARRWRIVVGVMAPRALPGPGRVLRGSAARARIAGFLDDVPAATEVFVLAGGGTASSRR